MKTLTPSQRRFIQVSMAIALIWGLYRTLFVGIPIWVEESIGKLIFFGLPAWLYSVISGLRFIEDGLVRKKLLPGIFLGTSFGMIFGLIGMSAIASGYNELAILPLLSSGKFWWWFFLALLTGFFESIFFFGFIFANLLHHFSHWSSWRALLLLASYFIFFHLPNTFIRYNSAASISFANYLAIQIFMLGIFALGQGLLYLKFRNLYLSTLVHAIWGIILLIYTI